MCGGRLSRTEQGTQDAVGIPGISWSESRAGRRRTWCCEVCRNSGRGQGKSTSFRPSRAIRPRGPGCARDGEGGTTDEKINE